MLFRSRFDGGKPQAACDVVGTAAGELLDLRIQLVQYGLVPGALRRVGKAGCQVEAFRAGYLRIMTVRRKSTGLEKKLKLAQQFLFLLMI